MAENTLNQDEVNALLHAVDGGQVALQKSDTKQRKIRVYDFTKPSRIPKEVLRVVRAIHENFAQQFGFMLSGFVRALVNVELVSADQLTYNEFMLSLPEYTCLNVISIPPVKGNFIIEINLNILLLFVERLLGGSAEESASIRPLTPLEISLSSKIIHRLLEAYRLAWKQVFSFSPQVERTETDPRFAQGLDTDELVLLLCFEVKLGKASGIINVCFPMATFEQLLPSIGSDVRSIQQNVSAELEKQFRSELLRLPLTVQSVLDTTVLKVREIAELKEGDIIRLDKPAEPAVVLTVAKKPIFSATIGLRNNKTIAVVNKKMDIPKIPAALPAAAPVAPAVPSRRKT
ncbi:MAG: flagellar motor switch protein FliM [Candidatus Omnitrophica bacterium]|nr:flagellar motor switch protein FliM [Candidatus Omnitrophota bacterium]